MTPTKQDIEFFTSEEAKQIQELWEPKFGDLVYIVPNQNVGVILRHSFSAMVEDNLIYDVKSPEVHSWFSRRNLIFLPRPDQLWKMLEERGLNWSCDYLREAKEEERYRAYCWSNKPIKGAKALVGPTPSIALGRALIEVLKEE